MKVDNLPKKGGSNLNQGWFAMRIFWTQLTTIGEFLRQLAVKSIFLASIIPAFMIMTGCQEPKLNKLEQIRKSGILRIATRNSPTTYYVQKDGPAGVEFELASQFAEFLGVTPVFVTEDNINDIFTSLDEQKADIAAAGLTATSDRKNQFLFGPPYQEISSKLVFKQGKKWPRNFSQLDGSLRVLANSSHASMLLELKKEFPELSWSETEEHSPEELLEMVLEETIDYTIVDSVELNLKRQFKTELAIAFTVGEAQQLAWALPKNDDYSLFTKVVEFFGQNQQSGKVAQLLDQYYGHMNDFDYVGARTFLKAAQTDLDGFKPMFQEAAGNDIDWRLLAAMGYQESHWNPKAKSNTGVRGIMMLTQNTAKQLGVKSRLDPEQSIYGGADYFRHMLERVPERIAEPDKTWFAMAAYNIGWGHVEDARVITQRQGGDPDKWIDVKQRLPLLKQKKYYKQSRFGYARGDEPVKYVNNIRRYFDVLVWLDEERIDNIDMLDAGEMIAESTPSKKASVEPRTKNSISEPKTQAVE